MQQGRKYSIIAGQFPALRPSKLVQRSRDRDGNYVISTIDSETHIHNAGGEIKIRERGLKKPHDRDASNISVHKALYTVGNKTHLPSGSREKHGLR